MPYKNIEDHKAYQKKYQKEWYKKNKKKHIKNSSILRDKYMKIGYEYINRFKTINGCAKCSECHVACLEFHHRDSAEKDFEISWAIKNGYSLKRIKQEMKKCDVLCSNCHKKLHWEERESNKK